MPRNKNRITIAQALEQGTEKLRQRNIESPAVVCELLLLHSLQIPRVELYLNLNRELKPSELRKFDCFLQERVKGKPAQYITHTASFYGLDLYVDENVLIPRPETEILVETVLKKLSASESPSVIIDWGTGSGNIAIAIARNLNCRVYATDISAGALEIAKKNVKRFKLAGKVKLFKGEGFKPLPKRLKGKVDAVVANPPYVRPGERKSLPVEVKDFEPAAALFDKENGLYFTQEIISDSKDFLMPGGLIALETALGLAEKVAVLLREDGNYAEIEVVKDLAGIERHVLARKKASQ